MRLVKDKIIMITGAADGIGASCASIFAQNGAKSIYIVDSDLDKAKATAMSIAARNGCECIPIKADITAEDEVHIVYDIIAEKAGRLDVLVNCAGLCAISNLDELDPQVWDFTMNANLKGAFLFSREALTIMRCQKSGRIINIASQSGDQSGLAVDSDYSSSKVGLVHLTKGLAKKAAEYGITVNAVAPRLFNADEVLENSGAASTKIGKRIGTEEEVADTVLFLASDMAKHMTGTCIDVNGGVAM
jgi:3-oxoacyl-[acyl-carrier protein] reductase